MQASIILHNNEFTSKEKISFDISERAIYYGDGFFETIIIKNGEIQLLTQHFNRISKGMRLLGFSDKSWNIIELEKKIKKLINKNRIDGWCKCKLIFWRKKGGLYKPLTNDFHYLIELTTINPFSKNHKTQRVGICESIRNYPSVYSFLKKTSALHYVLAAKEIKETNYDDLIILDFKGNISECTSSNLIFIDEQKKELHTPHIHSGCVEGTMLNYQKEKYLRKGYTIIERSIPLTDVYSFDSSYKCNVTGLIPIQIEIKKHSIK